MKLNLEIYVVGIFVYVYGLKEYIVVYYIIFEFGFDDYFVFDMY